MVVPEGAFVLQTRMDSILESFGESEGGAILEEVMERMVDGGSVTDWLDMISAVEFERHPYLRFAAQRPN
jgi:hypothetical protein